MKHFKIILIIIPFLALGIFLGQYLFSPKQEQNAIAPPVTTVPPSISNKQEPPLAAPIKAEAVDFIILDEDIPPSEEIDRVKLEEVFQTKKFTSKIIPFSDNQKSRLTAKGNIVGIASAELLTDMTKTAPYFAPKFTFSTDPKAECYKEVELAVLANEEIKSLEDLNGKIIGIDEKALVQAKLFLSEKKLIAKKIKVFSHNNKAFTKLSDKEVDAYFTSYKSFSNGTSVGNLGQNFSSIKIMYNSADQIPCHLIFFNQNMNRDLLEEVENKLSEVLFRPSTKEIAQKVLSSASFRPYLSQDWSKSFDLISRGQNIELKTLAEEVTQH